MPSLAEIIVPLGLPDQIHKKKEAPAEQITEEVGAYRRVRVQQKKKFQVSDSVGGHNLRLKRVRLETDGAETVRVRPLNHELLDAEFEGQEIRKKELFAFYNLDMKKENFSWIRASTSWNEGYRSSSL